MTDELTMTFTVKEWRLLAAAAAMANPKRFVQSDAAISELSRLANRIAKQTGKFGKQEDG